MHRVGQDDIFEDWKTQLTVQNNQGKATLKHLTHEFMFIATAMPVTGVSDPTEVVMPPLSIAVVEEFHQRFYTMPGGVKLRESTTTLPTVTGTTMNIFPDASGIARVFETK